MPGKCITTLHEKRFSFVSAIQLNHKFIFHPIHFADTRRSKRETMSADAVDTNDETKRPRLRHKRRGEAATAAAAAAAEKLVNEIGLPSLLDLNDDCLYELMEMLPATALAALASSCTRLRAIARKVFHIYHTNRYVKFDLQKVADENQESRCIPRILNVLRLFGDMIVKLDVTFGKSPQCDVANIAVAKWMCIYGSDKIEYLKLSRCRGPVCNELANGAALFRNVRDIELMYSDAICGRYLSVSHQLEKLVILGPKCVEHFAHTFPKLRTFSWSYSVFSQSIFRADKVALEQFLGRHQNLTDLTMSSLKPCNMEQLSELHQLESLTISLVEREDDIWPLGRLRNLKRLTVTLYGDSERELVRFLNRSDSVHNMEKITMIYFRLSISHEMMEAISRYTNLSVLELKEVNQMDDTHLVHLYKLHELRELTVTQSWLISTDGICGIIRNLPKIELLSLRLCSVAFDRRIYRGLGELYRQRARKLTILNHSISLENISEQFKDENLSDYVKCFQSKCKSH